MLFPFFRRRISVEKKNFLSKEILQLPKRKEKKRERKKINLIHDREGTTPSLSPSSPPPPSPSLSSPSPSSPSLSSPSLSSPSLFSHLLSTLTQTLFFLYFCYLSFTIRLFSVFHYGRVIHEFDPWFNFRATQFLVENGYAKFVHWFDYQSWYFILFISFFVFFFFLFSLFCSVLSFPTSQNNNILTSLSLSSSLSSLSLSSPKHRYPIGRPVGTTTYPGFFLFLCLRFCFFLFVFSTQFLFCFYLLFFLFLSFFCPFFLFFFFLFSFLSFHSHNITNQD